MKLSKYTRIIESDNDYVILYHEVKKHLILLSGDLYEYIKLKLKELELSDIRKNRKIYQLFKMGFILLENIDEKEALRYFINNMKYDKRLFSTFISFTSRCNLSCTYCYQDSRKELSNDFTEEKWQNLFKYILKRSESLNKVETVLFGGEPLLVIDLLRRATHELKSLEEQGIYVQNVLVTNGTLFTKEIGEELIGYVDAFQMTFDGLQDAHNKRRVYRNGTGTFDDILKNLLDNIDAYKNRIALRSNIDSSNLESVKEMLVLLKEEYALEKKLTVDFNYVFPTQTDISHGDCHKMTERITTHLLSLYEFAYNLGYVVGKSFIVGPCMASHTNSLAIDETLNIYKCPGRFYQTPDGYIDENSDLIITNNRWYTSVNYEPSCALDCVYGPICYGGCKWMSGEGKNVNCSKPHFDKSVDKILKLYVLSKYKEQIGSWVSK